MICGGAWRYLVEGIAANYARYRCKMCKAFPTAQCQYFQENVNETKNAVNDVRKAVSCSVKRLSTTSGYKEKTVNRKLGKNSHLSH